MIEGGHTSLQNFLSFPLQRQRWNLRPSVINSTNNYFILNRRWKWLGSYLLLLTRSLRDKASFFPDSEYELENRVTHRCKILITRNKFYISDNKLPVNISREEFVWNYPEILEDYISKILSHPEYLSDRQPPENTSSIDSPADQVVFWIAPGVSALSSPLPLYLRSG